MADPMRDPRNQEHLRQAVEFIKRNADCMARTNADKELAPYGIRLNLPRGEAGDGDLVIGGFYFLEDGLRFLDNELRRCESGRGCKRVVQFRPGVKPGVPVICLFCAVDAIEAARKEESKG